MKHGTDESTDPVETLPDHADDSSPRLIEKISVVVGILGSIFTVLSVAGYELLPSSTWGEKCLVFGATIALSAAAFAGIGAWHSARRFAVTASAAGIALMCIAALAIVAAGSETIPSNESSLNLPTSPARASSGSSAQSSTSDPAASASSSPSVNPVRTSSTSTPVSVSAGKSLFDMPPVSGSDSTFAIGPKTVDGHSYQTALYDVTSYDDQCVVGQDSFNLDRKYHDFRVTVGVADSTPLGDKVTFSFLLDGQQRGPSPTLPAGQTMSIDIDVTGVFRITLQDICSSSNSSGNEVDAVWINPVVR